MSDPIRIFVGTDSRMGKAEAVLEHSIRKHTDADVEFHWMRAGWDQFVVSEDGRVDEFYDESGLKIATDQSTWNIGRPPGKPYGTGGGRPGRWATDFTCFRWFVPELCNFEGYAIYLDADMMVLADIRELWEYRERGRLVSTARPDVFVVDCSAFKDDWYRIDQSKPTGRGQAAYISRLQRDKRWVRNGIPKQWNTLDRWAPGCKLIHFTNMRIQPWKPWPEAFNYPDKHPDPKAEAAFWELYEEAQQCASTS